ncbi:hypothetical protein [Sediminibacillus massiliensis]|uniref:hypothetical protein n=1 Tax=Sediminibacillus massiliensis TaxID=1926277 RepID=UPI00098856A4|nr:hypothetical protein [Sediminibacillus massiliensis]
MSQNPSTLSAYRFIKKSRFQKKKKLYKMALGVSFDVVICVYLGAFLVLGGFIAYDALQQYQNLFVTAEQFLSSNYLLIVLAMIVRSLFQSITKPGVLFTSAELKLSSLPYSREYLWLYCLLEKELSFIFAGSVVAIIAWLLTPLSAMFLFTTLSLVILLRFVLAIPQWILFQMKMWHKLVVIYLAAAICAGGRFMISLITNQITGLYLFFGILLIINLLLWNRAFKQVDWMRVIQTNDLLIWNMFFINKMSKMEIKPEKRNGWAQQLFQRKKYRKPFDYRKRTVIYKRLWRRSLWEGKELVLQTIGSILVLLVMLSFHGPWVLGVAVTLAVFLYGKMSASFFAAGFGEKLVHSLPWDLHSWKRSFLSWAYLAGIFLLIVLSIVLLLVNPSIWVPFQIILYICVTDAYLQEQLENRMALLSKTPRNLPIYEELFPFAWFCLLFLSIPYPIVSVVSILFFLKKTRKKQTKAPILSQG